MELDARQWILTMTQPHHRAVIGPRGDLAVGRQIPAIDDEGVIAGGRKRTGDAPEDRLLRVRDARHLAMHHLRCAADRSAEGLTQALMPQAYAQDGKRGAELDEKVLADARVGRRSRPGRQHNRHRTQRRDLCQGDLVVAPNHHVLAELTEVLHQVVGERIVVVDHQHEVFAMHLSLLPDPPPELGRRRPVPAAARTPCSWSRAALPPEPSRQRSRRQPAQWPGRP